MKLYARNDIFVNELFWLQEIKITIKKKKNEIKKKNSSLTQIVYLKMNTSNPSLKKIAMIQF